MHEKLTSRGLLSNFIFRLFNVHFFFSISVHFIFLVLYKIIFITIKYIIVICLQSLVAVWVCKEHFVIYTLYRLNDKTKYKFFFFFNTNSWHILTRRYSNKGIDCLHENIISICYSSEERFLNKHEFRRMIIFVWITMRNSIFKMLTSYL